MNVRTHAYVHTSQTREPGRREREHVRNRHRREPCLIKRTVENLCLMDKIAADAPIKGEETRRRCNRHGAARNAPNGPVHRFAR